MTQKEKLAAKIKNNPRNVSFDDLHKFLEMNGATWWEGGRKSHRVYNLNGQSLSIPRDKPVKAVYVKMAIELVEGKGE
ncbi:MAG TPA: toxin HicA [Methylomusa anaerophila]|uniref:YcfA-like protein n=1 Tax=Methylomusa anaerophila TaxID=1930071 RepID=A0A348AE86_9FIRM|nr:toxin HicA [Methylomusa anaerophila]BBB89384.1 hypothetical protein MAMMFC1_00017 [Methylomusa anaerophila]HML90461.1 toxin HicA [Methylomusa anaerophila]